MNLNKLFDTQRIIDARIEKEHPRVEGEDRLSKKILALLVELGELANEWRGFKFWSKDQEPSMKLIDEEFDLIHMESIGLEQKNPLLEEYVDCLHFILSIGLELDFFYENLMPSLKAMNITKQFNAILYEVSEIEIDIKNRRKFHLAQTLRAFIGLGEMLGLTWEQIEQAYYDKNRINHSRQDTGY